jgi:uncharacterized protein YehS (DUF1456 family)
MVLNDVLRSLRYALQVTDSGVADLVREGGGATTPQDVIAYQKRDDEPGFKPCPDVVLSAFLTGVIVQRRGRREGAAPRPPQQRLDNNAVLKSLRIAFELEEADILSMMTAAGFQVSRPELSALFRKPDHQNYRPAGDQFLRNFLKGLTALLRPDPTARG